MRATFVACLIEAIERGLDAYLISGDLGFGVFEDLRDKFPDRFVNVGVAEQQMTSLAAGMASEGAICFTYSIGNFATLRCLEQLRNDVCYTGAHVIAVAVGGGLAYGQLGPTHHATEDLAVMRSLPAMWVAAPGDPGELRMAFSALVEHHGPGYLRLGKSNEPHVHSTPPHVAPGELVPLSLRTDARVLVLSTGAILPLATAVVARLESQGIAASQASMPWLSPVDSASLESAFAAVDIVVTVEEHAPVGGLFGVVSEHMALNPGGRPRVVRFALPHEFLMTVGDRDYLLGTVGMDVDTMTNVVAEYVRLG